MTDDEIRQRSAAAPDNRDRDGRPFVITVHGIKTPGRWQKEIALELSDAKLPNKAFDFGYFFALQLARYGSRRKKVDWFAEQCTQICRERGIKRPSVVAHSFGTYLVAKAMQIHGLEFDRVVLCGSIVDENYHWTDAFENNHVRAVLNDYGGRDFWAWVAKLFVSDAGRSGRNGFNDRAGGRMVQVLKEEGRHGDFFTRRNYERL